MAVVDISGLTYFMPIFGFLFVFLIVYAILRTTKILGDENWINLIVGFIIAAIFSVVASAQELVKTITPWFAILAVCLFFILLIIGLSGKKVGDIMNNNFVWVIVVILIIGFLVSAVKVFPAFFGDSWNTIRDFSTNNGRIAGTIILVVIGALVAWVISPASKK